MNVLRSRLVTTISATLGVACLSPGTVLANSACYAFTDSDPVFARNGSIDGGPPIVLRYIATPVGPITTDEEAKVLHQLRQNAFSLVGKATTLIDFSCDGVGATVCPTGVVGPEQVRLMTTIDGTIITGKVPVKPEWSPDSPGTHMGINMHFLRRVSPFSQYPVGPVTLECSTSQVSATPAYWECNMKAEFDVGELISDSTFLVLAERKTIRLNKVNPATTPACGVFQDGALEVFPEQ
jgi:hypothetical protein